MRWDELTDEEKEARFEEASSYLEWEQMVRILFATALENDAAAQLVEAFEAERKKHAG